MPNTEADEGRHEEMRAYPEPPEMSRADLAQEAAWWDWWWAEGRFQEADPHGWPTCQGCGQRGHENACDHGKNICPECWPDKCWGCQADASDAESTW